MMIFYEPLSGQHIFDAATECIALAKKYNRKAKFRFNGLVLTVNKRLSPKHVTRTFHHMMEAARLRYQKTEHYKKELAKRLVEIAEVQRQIDFLVTHLPTTKVDAIEWLAKWIPLSDDVDINRYADNVLKRLKHLGFVSGQHVGAPEFKGRTASRMMRIEYVAGQVIDMLEKHGCVHPMLGKWAKDIAAEKEQQSDSV